MEPPFSLLASFVLEQIDYPLQESIPVLEQFKEFWSEKKALVLLDGLEKMEHFSPFLQQWLQQSPHTKFLISSRNSTLLNVTQELVLEGLDASEEDSAAFQFFCEGLDPSHWLEWTQQENQELFQQVCAKLGGHPLLLQQVSQWSFRLSVEDFLKKIQQWKQAENSLFSQTIEDSWDVLFQEQKQSLLLLRFLEEPFSLALASGLTKQKPFVLFSLVKQKWLIHDESNQTYRIHDLFLEFLHSKNEKELSEEHEMQFLRYFLQEGWQRKKKRTYFSEELLHWVHESWSHVAKACYRAIEQKQWLLLQIFCPMLSAYCSYSDKRKEEMAFWESLFSALKKEVVPPEALLLAYYERVPVLLIQQALSQKALDFVQQPIFTRFPSLEKTRLRVQGAVASLENQLEKAETHFVRLLELLSREAEKNEDEFCFVSIFLGSVRIDLQKMESGWKDVIQGIQLAEEIGNIWAQTFGNAVLFSYFKNLRQWDQAELCLTKGFSLSKSIEKPIKKMRFFLFFAELNLEQKKWDSALEYAQASLELSIPLQRRWIRTNAELLLSRIYEETGQPEKSLVLLQEKISHFSFQKEPQHSFLLCVEQIMRIFRIVGQKKHFMDCLIWLCTLRFRQNDKSQLLALFLEWSFYLVSEGQEKQAFLVIQYVFAAKDYQPRFHINEEAKTLLFHLFEKLGKKEVRSLQNQRHSLKKILSEILSFSPLEKNQSDCFFCECCWKEEL